MKGITHFAAGIAIVSFLPGAVNAGMNGNPLYFILAGIFGLLPDTIDFKIARFFAKNDIEVIPDPHRRDPQMIAEAIRLAIDRAASSRKPVRLKLNSIKLAADEWQSYKIVFDTVNRKVTVTYGPIVDTGGNPVNSSEPEDDITATAALGCAMKVDYQAAVTVDILEGPTFEFQLIDDRKINASFIPWHRSWSHSFVVGLLFSLVAVVAWDVRAGMAAMLAYSAHICVDQLGFLGSNLFYPFTHKRTEGLKRLHSGDPVPNLLIIWASCLVVFWNLYRASEMTGGPSLVHLFLYGLGLPWLAYILAKKWFLHKQRITRHEQRRP